MFTHLIETCPHTFLFLRRVFSAKVPAERYLFVTFSIISISRAACNCLSQYDRRNGLPQKWKPVVISDSKQAPPVLVRGARDVLGSAALDLRYLLRDVLQVS